MACRFQLRSSRAHVVFMELGQITSAGSPSDPCNSMACESCTVLPVPFRVLQCLSEPQGRGNAGGVLVPCPLVEGILNHEIFFEHTTQCHARTPRERKCPLVGNVGAAYSGDELDALLVAVLREDRDTGSVLGQRGDDHKVSCPVKEI